MASISDVANLANVSIATVSRVLTGSSHPVSEETRVRVLEAARALNYSPSALAKAMVTGDTRIVGVIIGDATDPYFAAILRGVEDVARKHGYLVIVCNSDRVPAIELKYLRTLNDYRVDGVIFAGGGLLDDAYLHEVRQALEVFYTREAVCVSLGKHLFPSLPVLVDNEQVVKDAVDYLIQLGHSEIAYISGPSHLTTAELRLSGYKEALEFHKLSVREGYICNGDYTFESGLNTARAVDRLPRKPTAIIASNDVMAMGCIIGLKELGYHVPGDISVMGVDDVPTARIVDPPLTTMALPLYDLGAIGMESLIRLRSGDLTLNDIVMLPHQLVVRKSTAPPPNAHQPPPLPQLDLHSQPVRRGGLIVEGDS
jgi:LacI family transcriptional regulator